LLAIKNIFPRATNYICSWHCEQNFKKKSSHFNRGKDQAKKDMYQLIRTLPYVEDEEDFEQRAEKILKSRLLTKDQKGYLEEKVKEKHTWVKAFMKRKFTCGMCSTTRIESKHRVFKLYLNSNSKLNEMFKIFKQLEAKEIFTFKDEIEKLSKKEEEKLEKCNLIKFFSSHYSQYVLAKLKQNLIESNNYKFRNIDNIW